MGTKWDSATKKRLIDAYTHAVKAGEIKRDADNGPVVALNKAFDNGVTPLSAPLAKATGLPHWFPTLLNVSFVRTNETFSASKTLEMIEAIPAPWSEHARGEFMFSAHIIACEHVKRITAAALEIQDEHHGEMQFVDKAVDIVLSFWQSAKNQKMPELRKWIAVHREIDRRSMYWEDHFERAGANYQHCAQRYAYAMLAISKCLMASLSHVSHQRTVWTATSKALEFASDGVGYWHARNEMSHESLRREREASAGAMVDQLIDAVKKSESTGEHGNG